MRLIDADKIKYTDLNADVKVKGHKEIPPFYIAFKDKIDAMPTVERKHGHWERRDMDIVEHPFHCTQCGWSNYHIDRYVESFKFCPECSARMNEVSE